MIMIIIIMVLLMTMIMIIIIMIMIIVGDIIGEWCEAWDYFFFAVFLWRAKLSFEAKKKTNRHKKNYKNN